MKKFCILLLAILSILQTDAFAENEIKTVSGVYVGGHIRRERPRTIATLRNSGFTYVLLFNVHVDKDGTLKTDGETICKNGEYVFANTQPYYQQDVKDLKTAPTSIQRIEIVIGGWGNDSYDHIRDLINANGTGSTTMLYKNFKALKEAIPEIDAVNNDDEQCYDVETGAKFHIMMANLGYQTTLAPYTRKSYWQDLCNKIRASKPKAVDRIMVQCYDGGAGNVNSVNTWTFTGVTERHAGLCTEGNHGNWNDNMSSNEAQFAKWRDEHGVGGGFVWVYNDESWNLNQTATAMNRVYKAIETPEEEAMVEVFSGSNYTGYSVKLPVGSFELADLAVYGITANDIESIKVLKEGVTAKLYTSNNCKGAYNLAKANKTLTTSYKNKINSILVDYTEPEPCAAPEISFKDGKLYFKSETPKANCNYTIEAQDAKTGTADSVALSATYTISAYATATGFGTSPVTTATLIFDMTGSNDEEDGIIKVGAKAMLISSEDNGVVRVKGLCGNEDVTIYTSDGKLMGRGRSINGEATIQTSAMPGTALVIKAAGMSAKVVL